MAKQVWYSELLDKTFESEEECIAAEEKENEKLEAEKAKKAERKERAEAVEKAFRDADEAYKNARTKLNDFIKDYGAYHQTYKVTKPAKSLFGLFFNDFDLF